MYLAFRNDLETAFDGTTLTLRPNSDSPTPLSLSKGLAQAFGRLSTESHATERELADSVVAAEGFMALSRFHRTLRSFERLALITRVVAQDGEPLLTLRPTSSYFAFKQAEIAPNQQVMLSRFALLRRHEDTMLLESPLGYAELILHSDVAACLVTGMFAPVSAETLHQKHPSLTPETINSTLQLLHNSDMLTSVDDAGIAAEEQRDALRQWEFHDLYFHTRSRTGRTRQTADLFRFVGEIDPLPAIKPAMSDHAIALPKPKLEELAERDPSLTTVMRARKSWRAYGAQPITLTQLGEFLYRVGRVDQIFEYLQEQNGKQAVDQTSRRPYPAGGARYSLELYIAVHNCEGIKRGFYHYHPLEHQLYALPTSEKQLDQLIQQGVPMPGGDTPQVLVTIASRFPRATWKYPGTAYALILKNVGVLYQTMYLAATAMGIGGCGLGIGNPDLFAQLAQTDYFTESSVGEFALGSLPANENM